MGLNRVAATARLVKSDVDDFAVLADLVLVIQPESAVLDPAGDVDVLVSRLEVNRMNSQVVLAPLEKPHVQQPAHFLKLCHSGVRLVLHLVDEVQRTARSEGLVRDHLMVQGRTKFKA